MYVQNDNLRVEEWLAVVEAEYLSTYILNGGSSVKVAVGAEKSLQDVQESLSGFALQNNFEYAHVDAGKRRLHLVHGIFSEVAVHIDWRRAARDFLCAKLLESGRELPQGALTIASLAEINGEAEELLYQDVRRLLNRHVYSNYNYCREFRSAAMALCLGALDSSEDVQQKAIDVCSWLRGELLPGASLLRQLGIYRKISRTDARSMLCSTTYWLRQAGRSGLIVTLDFSRYAERQPSLEGFKYSKYASLDMHEVLRQFLDSADEFCSSLFVFLTSEGFLVDAERGLNNYEALRLRLTDDVRDRNRANPFAPMIRLAEYK